MIDPTLLNSSLTAPAPVATVWMISPGDFVTVAALVGSMAFVLGWLSGYGWKGKHGRD